MKVENEIILLSVILGIFAGAVDGIMTWLFFYEGSLLDILIFDVPTREFYIRSIILLTFVTFGAVLSRDFARRREAEEALAASNRFLELFIDIINHDLMNKAGVIKGLAEVLEDEELPEEARNEVGMIGDTAKKLEELITSAVGMSRLEMMKELSKRDLDLVPMIEEVSEELKNEAKEKGIDVQLKLGKSAVARVNPFLRDVFFNLISNAIKYSPEGSTVVAELSDQGGFLRFRVEDSGEGVEDEHRKSIFERFSRRHKEGVKGSGLGLAIVKRVVDLHDGRVWVEDNPEGGSVFYVEIPASLTKN